MDTRVEQDGATREPAAHLRLLAALGYLAAGTGLGLVFIQSQVLSWYRIQEMFRFESIHMYGVIGVAIAVAALGSRVVRLLSPQALDGSAFATTPKVRTPMNVRYWLGGFTFGLGWGLLGACPGPIFTLIGAGHTIYLVPLLAALAGTYAYARVQHRLPH